MGFRRHFVFIPRRISISHLTTFPTFTDKNPGDDTAHARFQRASDAYECLNRPDGCDLHESYQYSDDEDGDFGEAFVFFSMGGGGFGFAPGSRAGGAAEFFRHFWSADFDDDHFDEQQRSWEEVEQKRAERERRRQKDEREAKKARQRRRDLEAAAAERKRWEKGCEKREQAAHAAAATASKAEALRENKSTQRVAAANAPPPPWVVHRDSNEITLHFSRRGVRRGVRVRHDQGNVRGDRNGRGGACYDRERDTGVPLINARFGLSLVIWKEGFANEETFEQSETVDSTALDASPSRSKSIRRQEGEETHAGEGERRRTATRFGFRARSRTRRDFRRRRKVGTGRGGTREGAGGVRLK